MLAIDASLVVAALIDEGPEGRWAEEQLLEGGLVAPHLLPVEVANILRLAALRGDVSNDVASLAHADLISLPIELYPYEPFAERVWQLRGSITSYDAWYVALAEVLDAPLATLDGRLARASGPLCKFLTPRP